MIHAGLLRKLGRFDESLAVARDTSLVPDGWHSRVAQGLALREIAADTNVEAVQKATGAPLIVGRELVVFS